jgi:hypothetical protein
MSRFETQKADELQERNEQFRRLIDQGINPPGLASFRREYISTMTVMKRAAEKRLGASMAKKARGQTTCWKLLNRLRSPSTAVAIDAETLISHFENIFFDRSEPLIFDLPTLGIPRPIDYFPEQFSDAELVIALSDLNAQAAVGPQRISSSYIKTVFSKEKSRVPLLALMNRCLYEGKVPSAWGRSEVFVLYKGKGDKKLPVNYRGINLNDDFLRLFERLLDKRLSSWLSVHQPWGNQQFGFCSGVGTEDAALCLQTLAGICTKVKGFPLFANFVDLQRAFPSMLRTQILKTLHTIGVPYGLIQAFAATFSGNSCRLRIGDNLTRAFPVNRGTKEGGINSPKIFNTVYATALKKLGIAEFPESVSLVQQNEVYYLVFADDLVLLSGNLAKLEELSNQLTGVLAPLGMAVNTGKTKWLAFLPDRVTAGTPITSKFSLELQGDYLENVEIFRYLGFDMAWNLSKTLHQKRREDLQSLAARSIGRLMKQLGVTNFISLRAYYTALVRSQLYSLNFSVFSEEEHDRAQKIFVQNVFSLPASFPIRIACFFMGVPDLTLSMFEARTRFLSRIAGFGSVSSLAAMALDREELLPLNVGWNKELLQALEKYLDAQDVDLLNAQEVAMYREDLRRAITSNDKVRQIENSASNFILEFFPHASIPRDFASFFGNLPYESVRIMLIFFANMFQFSYLRTPKRVCPFCPGQLSSMHFFLCPSTPSPFNDWASLIGEFRAKDYWRATDRIFLTLQRWASISNKFTPGFGAKIEEYFQSTEEIAGRRNDSRLAHQLGIRLPDNR